MGVKRECIETKRLSRLCHRCGRVLRREPFPCGPSYAIYTCRAKFYVEFQYCHERVVVFDVCLSSHVCCICTYSREVPGDSYSIRLTPITPHPPLRGRGRKKKFPDILFSLSMICVTLVPKTYTLTSRQTTDHQSHQTPLDIST